MYSGRLYVENIHRISKKEETKLQKLGWIKLSKSVGKKGGYIEIEAKNEQTYLTMVYRIRHLTNNLEKYQPESCSMKVYIGDMCKLTNSEIKKLKRKDIVVVKYDNELPHINDNIVWCTIYADDKIELYNGYDRVTKLVRGDILRGSKWCGKHNRFSN
jgi:hypothetical protein